MPHYLELYRGPSLMKGLLRRLLLRDASEATSNPIPAELAQPDRQTPDAATQAGAERTDEPRRNGDSPRYPPGPRAFFLMGCARSGTTSLCRILDQASNATVRIEPAPNLNVETRDLMEGRLAEPYQTVARAIMPRVASVLDDERIYGEKNVTLGPFIPHLNHLFNARFVLIVRDGRDVVRSLLDWHEQLFGNIYRECREECALSPRAAAAADSLSIEDDTSDYARPRPGPSDTWYPRWEKFTRLEMCAWYWSRINGLYLDNLAALPGERWRIVDYTRPSATDVLDLADFLDLEGLAEATVKDMLKARINSLSERIDGAPVRPRWPEWSSIDRVKFENIAAPMMQRLGYYPRESFVRYKPVNYGDWWRQHEGGTEWYEWMYQSRISAHEDLKHYVERLERHAGPLSSVLEVGCGRAVGYAELFDAKRYVGVDLSEKEIAWCRENRRNPRHSYLMGDFIAGLTDETFDLVFSQGTIDNIYDMDAWIAECVRRSHGFIYITAYRGWFPELVEHRYVWEESTTCHYNDISPAQVTGLLRDLGCQEIEVTPLRMVGGDIAEETRITARVANAGEWS